MASQRERMPVRPRLADHVLARRHLLGTRTQIVLHDVARDTRIVLGAREWAVLSFADGSRDLEGLRIALAADGLRVEPEMLASFFAGLHDEALIVDGSDDVVSTERAPVAARGATEPSSADRPVRALPGYTFHCDASGLCCGLYPTILFAPIDVVNARAAMPDVLDGGAHASLAFTPERGSRFRALAAGAFRDGRCAYLRDDGLCAVHAKTGEASKPVGCRLYPLTYVDDGDSVRVSLVPECPCAYRSSRGPEGAPLVATDVTRRDQIEVAAHVDRIPESIAISSTRTISSETLPAWSLAIHDAAHAASPATLLALASWIERHDLDLHAARNALFSLPPVSEMAAVVAPMLASLASLATRRVREDEPWRDGKDAVSRGLVAVAHGASALGAPMFLETALDDDAVPDDVRDDERFYVRAASFGHHWIGRRPLADVLRDRATRMLVARAIALGLAGPDPFEHPLGRVEAIVRTHGLSRYA